MSRSYASVERARVGVLEAQDERAAALAREEVVEEGRARRADVERPGRARGDAAARSHAAEARPCGPASAAGVARSACRARTPRQRPCAPRHRSRPGCRGSATRRGRAGRRRRGGSGGGRPWTRRRRWSGCGRRSRRLVVLRARSVAAGPRQQRPRRRVRGRARGARLTCCHGARAWRGRHRPHPARPTRPRWRCAAGSPPTRARARPTRWPSAARGPRRPSRSRAVSARARGSSAACGSRRTGVPAARPGLAAPEGTGACSRSHSRRRNGSDSSW